MENLEILKNIKDYMQWCIDRGYHKFTYNDLGWDFKCIDAINLIDAVLNHLAKQEKMIKEHEKMIIRHKEQLRKAGIYGYDYDLKVLTEESE